MPVGAFLSGGIDSSAVVATMAQLTSGRVKTFSIGFAEAEYNELAHARRVAEAFGTDHHELVLRPDVVQIAEDLAWYLDEPFGDTSAIPTYMVSKLAAEHVKVVLTGDGGDELFAGYDKYVDEGRERRYDRVPRPIRQIAGRVGRVHARRHAGPAIPASSRARRRRGDISTPRRCSGPTRCASCFSARRSSRSPRTIRWRTSLSDLARAGCATGWPRFSTATSRPTCRSTS